jgi:hypothetical protein
MRGSGLDTDQAILVEFAQKRIRIFHGAAGSGHIVGIYRLNQPFSQSGGTMQSSSVKAIKSPLARPMPLFRVLAGEPWDRSRQVLVMEEEVVEVMRSGGLNQLFLTANIFLILRSDMH